MFKKILGRIAAIVFAVAWRKIDALKDAVVKYILSTLVRAGELIVKALVDDEGNDAEQIKVIAKDQAGIVAGELVEIAKGKVEGLKDKELKEALNVNLDVMLQVVRALLDDVKDNEAQLRDIIATNKAVLYDENVDVLIEKIKAELAKKVKDEFVLSTVGEILDTIKDALRP